jgi:hypothetical protein
MPAKPNVPLMAHCEGPVWKLLVSFPRSFLVQVVRLVLLVVVLLLLVVVVVVLAGEDS